MRQFFAYQEHGLLSVVGNTSFLVLIFLQPFNQFGALRLLAMLIAALCLVGLAIRGRKRREVNLPKVFSPYIGLALIAWITIAATFGPYVQDSLIAMRQGLLVQVVVFTAGYTWIRTITDAWRLALVALAGFALVSVLSLSEVIPYFWANGISTRLLPGHNSWWGGYGNNGGFYIPLLVGSLLLAPCNRTLRICGLVLLGLSSMLVLLYGSKSALISILLGCLTFIFIYYPFKRSMHWAIGLLFLFALLVLSPLGKSNKYDKLLHATTYVTDSGLSARLSVWQGVLEVTKVRPITGYGYGWKKLAWAINDQGFAERWQAEGGTKASYYLGSDGKASYGRVNPHNYFLQILFEIGVIGLALVLLFWACVIRDAAPLLQMKFPQEVRRFTALVFGVLTAYMVANMGNGHWVGGLANVSLALASCLLALRKVTPPSEAPVNIK